MRIVNLASRSSRRSFLGAAFAAGLAGLALGVSGTGQAVAQETIKLGFIGPLSGGNAQQGLGARNGFLLAVTQANESGYPYKVEGEALDDASDPQTGVSAALKLVNDPAVVAAIGHWNSPVALATIPVFDRAGVPFIIWGAISPKITEQNLPMVTRVTPTLAQENEPLAKWIANDHGKKQLAIISDTSDYGTQNTAAFTKFFKDAGGEIIAQEAAPVGTTDFRAILTKIKAQNPEGIYFGGVITEAGLVRKQMADLGMDIPMYGISGIYDPKFLEIAGEAANGTIVSVPKVKENEKLTKFQQDYEAAKFPEPAGPYAKYAYDATNILLQVIKEHGPEDKQQLAKAIRDISYDGVLGTTTFDETGQTEIEVITDIQVAKDGKWVPWGQM
jgi:branched-chain amino acid transport system substrate-binding protein